MDHGEEEDPKEYRWETGYEKTWYILLKYFFFCPAPNLKFCLTFPKGGH